MKGKHCPVEQKWGEWLKETDKLKYDKMEKKKQMEKWFNEKAKKNTFFLVWHSVFGRLITFF